MHHIAILDFGSQYTHLIARRIRELEVRADLYPADIDAKDLPPDVVGIILSGGPQSVYDENAPQIDTALFERGVPILGLCYGHQLIAKTLGGTVEAGTIREYGKATLTITDASALLENIAHKTQVWMSHGDTVTQLPPDFRVIGTTKDCPNAAVANETNTIIGLQFHPEVHHSTEGLTMLKHFVFTICRAEKNWNIEHVVEDILTQIQTQVADKKVFMLVSGGVDSSVAFALATKALGKERVYGLYVDTGFMRKDESQEITQNLSQAGFNNIHVHDAHVHFLDALKGIVEPEEKRKIIGKVFLDIREQVSQKLGLDSDEWLLGQGTIYPDTIETGGTKHADTIKTHHNRVDAIQKLIAEGKVVEPISDFYKDEVRHIGTLLGLPQHMIDRHPFPGPGLAIRMLCTNAEKDDLPPIDTDPTLLQSIKHSIVPIQSVGVQGDNRTYEHPLAFWGMNDWEQIDELSSTITNASKVINRTMVLLNPQEKAIELAPTQQTLTQERITLLQDIDALVMQTIREAGLYHAIWQFPVVLIPVGHTHYQSIVLRPIESQEAMTAHFYRMDHALLEKLTQDITTQFPIDYVFYDTTNKPPGTIEWE